MDAASKIKSYGVALLVTFASTCFAQSETEIANPVTLESPCEKCSESKCCDDSTQPSVRCADADSDAPITGSINFGRVTSDGGCEGVVVLNQEKTSIGSFLSSWLAQPPKLSANFSIHFGSDDSRNKLGNNVPVIAVPTQQSSQKQQISKPMKFAERVSRIQLGELVGDVIVCGHRICSGNKCYDVKDEPVVGTHCDNLQNGQAPSNEPAEDEEPILIVPMAPPAPPSFEVAFAPVDQCDDLVKELGNANVSVPVHAVVKLMIANKELSTRLEMTEQLIQERQFANEQVQSLTEQNAKLHTQVAVAEARQQISDMLTASIVERAELAMRLAAVDNKSNKSSESHTHKSVQAIQEDLSNIRRQIALLRKTQPVPFAPSYVGLSIPRPYIPTAQLPAAPSTSDEETNTSSAESDGGSESTIK